MAPPNTSGSAPKSSASMSFGDQPVALKAFILVFAVSAVAGIYYFAFHMGLSEDIERATREHGALVTQRSEAVQRQQDFVRVSQALAEREPVDRRNRRILPENPEMAAFLGDVNRIAELSGLSIDLVEPNPESPDEFYVRIPVRLKFHGRFHQYAKFFYSVSQLERAVNMENLNIIVDPSSVAAANSRQQPGRSSGQSGGATGAAMQVGGGESAVADVILRVELMATTFRRPSADNVPAAGGSARPGARTAAPARRPAAGGMR